MANGLQDLEVLRGEASQQFRTQDQSAPSRGDGGQSRARETPQVVGPIRPKKARTMIGTDIVPVSSGQSALDLMSTLIDAAESIFKGSRRGVP